MALCAGCQLQVLKEFERLDAVRNEQIAALRRENKQLYDVIKSLELQRAGHLFVIELIGEQLAQKTKSDNETLALPMAVVE
jgi:hypothetical protein